MAAPVTSTSFIHNLIFTIEATDKHNIPAEEIRRRLCEITKDVPNLRERIKLITEGGQHFLVIDDPRFFKQAISKHYFDSITYDPTRLLFSRLQCDLSKSMLSSSHES